MMVGFGFIIYGIIQAFRTKPGVPGHDISALTPAVVATVSGIVTEFIGATFLFIYRSTIQQASHYTQTLERINAVGMAMQILDTISDESKELQDKTKAEIVKLLIQHDKPKSEKKQPEDKEMHFKIMPVKKNKREDAEDAEDAED